MYRYPIGPVTSNLFVFVSLLPSSISPSHDRNRKCQIRATIAVAVVVTVVVVIGGRMIIFARLSPPRVSFLLRGGGGGGGGGVPFTPSDGSTDVLSNDALLF